MKGPPRPAVRLLARALRGDPAGPAILGDLREDYARVVERRGRTAADLWYWREVVGLVSGRASRSLAEGARSAFRQHLESLVEDAARAARTLRRSPGFTLFAATVIGAGVGAVTSVYSLVKPLAFDLPFEEAHELVWVSNVGEAGDSSLSAVTSRTINLIDFRERARSFSGITGYDAFFSGRPRTLTGAGGGEPERIVGVGVAHDFLDILEVEPVAGRGFTEAEGRRDGPPALLLSHDFWRSRFAGDPDIVGRTLVVDDEPRTVVGVLPPDFDFSSVFAPGVEVDVLLPFVVSRDRAFQGNVLALVGRLKPGVTPEAAQAELSALLVTLQEEEPDRWGLGARVVPLRAHLAGPFHDALLLLVAAAGVLLLIVCVNVSGLFLARAPAREREVAVRKALGAPRGRLVRQFVLETLGISLVGAILGSLLAWLVVPVVRSTARLRIPLVESAEVDAAALVLATGVAVVTGIAVAIVPALRVAEGEEAGVLRAASAGSSQGRRARNLGEALVVAEVTLACVLLVAVALLTGSFRAVLEVDLGFEPSGTVAWQLQPGTDFESHEEESAFYARLTERVEAAPGIDGAGLVDALPLGRNRAWTFDVVGRADDEDTEEGAFPHVIDPGYLPTMRIPLVAGRNFTASDGEDSPRVLLLNETGARRLFGGAREALGRRLAFWGPWEWEVVGVARDVRHISPETGSGVEVYFPLAQMPDFTTMDLVVRSGLPEERVATAVSAILAEVDPGMPTQHRWSLASTAREAVADRRFALGLLSGFGAAALLMAGLGIYGVLARTVAERRREIGIRIALGASPSAVAFGVLRRMLLLAAGGVASGWILSLLLSGLLDSLMFRTEATDPAAFLATALALLVATGVAAALPARRAVSTEVSSVLEAR